MRNHLWFGSMNNSPIKFEYSRWRLVALLSFAFLLLPIKKSSGQTADDIIDNPNKAKTIPGHGMSQGEYPFDEDGRYRKEWVSTTAKSPVKESTTYRLPIPITSEEHSNYSLFAKGTLKEAKDKAHNPADEVTPPSIPGNSLSEKKSTPPPEEPGNQIIPAMFVMTEVEARSQGFIGPYSKMVESKPAPTSGLSSKRPSSNIILAGHTIVEKPAQAATRKETPTAAAPSKPVTTATTPVAPPTTPSIVNPVSSSPTYHKVISGDTLYSLHRKYGVSMDSLKKANGLTSDIIRIGQSLRIPLS